MRWQSWVCCLCWSRLCTRGCCAFAVRFVAVALVLLLARVSFWEVVALGLRRHRERTSPLSKEFFFLRCSWSAAMGTCKTDTYVRRLPTIETNHSVQHNSNFFVRQSTTTSYCTYRPETATNHTASRRAAPPAHRVASEDPKEAAAEDQHDDGDTSGVRLLLTSPDASETKDREVWCTPEEVLAMLLAGVKVGGVEGVGCCGRGRFTAILYK